MALMWTLLVVLFIADVAHWAVLSHTLRQQRYLREHQQTEPAPPYDDHHIRGELSLLRKDIGDDFEEVAGRIKHLTAAIAEGIERVDRSERRVAATVARAQKKLALAGYEDPGVEAEVEGLRLLDEDGIGTGGLPALHADVANPGDQPSSVPGITVAQLQKARGL